MRCDATIHWYKPEPNTAYFPAHGAAFYLSSTHLLGYLSERLCILLLLGLVERASLVFFYSVHVFFMFCLLLDDSAIFFVLLS